MASQNIKELKEKVEKLYDDEESDFRRKFDAAIRGLTPPTVYPDSDVYKDWRGATGKTLAEFFVEWYDWDWKQPISDGLRYIRKFSWISYENAAGLAFVTSESGREVLADFTQLQGRQMDSTDSEKLVQKWIDELGPKRMADFKKGDWSTLNKFFIRELKPGKRPIDYPDDPSVVTAPTDCIVNMIVDNLAPDTPLPIKAAVTMSVSRLLDGSKYAEKFIGGTAVSCILMPDTYHRYHAPVGGRVVEARDDIGGVYYGIRDFPDLLNKGNVGYGYDYSLFEDFRRGYAIIKTPYVDHNGDPDGEGFVALVPVGLNSIGSVRFLDPFRRITEESTPVEVKKGDEIGYFQYGGSLNILLFEEKRFPALQLLLGQRIGVLQEVAHTERYIERYVRPLPGRVTPTS
ncbi:phosphatidylserine decarboxylase [Kitasatospora sp. NPDC058048]|uniref:phosphatidylserine decarboxylase n=1 Tax=Kitasatospora sp. NPDC058048 TaxID=3346313 RepID=UPI0036DA137B